MTLAYWESLRALEQLSQSMQGLLATYLESCCQPAIWVGETETTCIKAVEIQETDTEVILRVQFSDIETENLDVELTQETVLIQERPTELDRVEGYFCPDRFQSLIPLPCQIQPEMVQADLYRSTLTLRLVKKLSAVQRQKVQLNRASRHPCLLTTLRAS
jgi:HSP20 family molecular chaperone IbpA